MPVVKGAQAMVTITLVASDNFTPIVGAIVEIQQFDQAIGDFRTIATVTTHEGGQIRQPLALPSVAGRYRYRPFYRGSPDFRPDRGPETTIDVV